MDSNNVAQWLSNIWKVPHDEVKLGFEAALSQLQRFSQEHLKSQ